MMPIDQVLDSLEWHFIATPKPLTPGGWASHKERGRCDDCDPEAQDSPLASAGAAAGGLAPA